MKENESLDSNLGPLVLKVTALPSVSQPLPFGCDLVMGQLIMQKCVIGPICSLTTMKLCQNLKKWPKTFQFFCRDGEISPNLVTLSTG